ncbi:MULTISPECIES: anhydro-N-acetylmuramic acid kinase [unclassified Synechocystis]|uniref:Anhydro-N-acetylmuramic acid kinase n=1 Tax=Synechocystis sp. (strain ATCC 27184 / PCC 6803 / Kazusa) TaxID=1111708 RepID=ANMK_SYNY3|nr:MULTISPECIES: anhydro-N-acetylmuramic acid kinase [unclassified Synechocystis]P74706.2 RecName: Full=Anhydro-N-acetylmuramic acid kinase; AltName: Full=AnhMurNAc kinase [Synechocystis sp. PCC 6803 substr. Kazusa]AVP91107.1 anhydro-N-acetylmuramic acid kinase [Synechocystis sp. IPPAS B-1465]BAM53300.1 anhydro-N-acetylmuramic acid kinase [Synechocystis sp. PCC 6803] [Bacillus subtilis BEST7613]ALJ69244.1 anhydro-N-acetylmuramic acid kinase [Synechocystis sp. PCC 6803]MBD2619454.1 anhydro-N-ac
MYCIGLISGTSVDGIDACLVDISGSGLDLKVDLLRGETYPYPDALRQEILALCAGTPVSPEAIAFLDDSIAKEFAQAAQQIQQSLPPADLIGSHGQTIFHRPPNPEKAFSLGYSWQLGRGEAIANLTGITTVSNFRAADIAAGGQGAPLVSKIDVCLLSHQNEHRCVQNLGGIGNVTYLPPRSQTNWQEKICGWDTGPANVLVDLAVQKFTQGEKTYDQGGQWAAQGKPRQELVDQWLQEPFFEQYPPKSTGRELFGALYLDNCWIEAQRHGLNETDFLTTLTEFTARSVVTEYQRFLPQLPDRLLLCGGGAHNLYLRERLQYHLGSNTKIQRTDDVGLNSDFKEAIAFAVLAYWRFQEQFPGNVPLVTGASQDCLLGDIHLVPVGS